MSLKIDQESRQRSRLAIDINFMTERFKTSNGLFTFPSPSLWTIEKNLFYLLRNSVQKDFERRYVMKPSYLSFEEYNTVALANLLMYVNGVQCIEEFDLDTVIIPTFQSILNICKDRFPKTDVKNLSEVNW